MIELDQYVQEVKLLARKDFYLSQVGGTADEVQPEDITDYFIKLLDKETGIEDDRLDYEAYEDEYVSNALELLEQQATANS